MLLITTAKKKNVRGEQSGRYHHKARHNTTSHKETLTCTHSHSTFPLSWLREGGGAKNIPSTQIKCHLHVQRKALQRPTTSSCFPLAYSNIYLHLLKTPYMWTHSLQFYLCEDSLMMLFPAECLSLTLKVYPLSMPCWIQKIDRYIDR